MSSKNGSITELRNILIFQTQGKQSVDYSDVFCGFPFPYQGNTPDNCDIKVS